MKVLARALYHRLFTAEHPVFRSASVETDLLSLHTGGDAERIKEAYYVKKICIAMMILLVGSIIGVLLRFSASADSELGEDYSVVRGGDQDEAQQMILTANDGIGDMNFTLEVSPKLMNRTERNALIQEFFNQLEGLILGENTDLNHVVYNLQLKNTYAGFPFQISWESSRMDLLDKNGKIGEVQETVPVELTCKLKYGEYLETKVMNVSVVPPSYSEDELAYLELQEYLVKLESGNREEERFFLPKEWKGKELTWKKEVGDYSVMIWMLTPVVAMLLFVLSDRDLHSKLEQRRQKMHLEYPEIVHKLALYAGAGMTIRGAFRKIGRDYAKKERKGGERPTYEEILYICRELDTGVSERTAYENFGRRTGLREYIKLCTLLGQNLKRGNSALLERLREEADNALQETILQVKKAGEEAGTKVLIPMVMMLGVVMVMIMVPAFGTM